VTFKTRAGSRVALGSLLLLSPVLILGSSCTPQPVTVTREPLTLHLVAADSCAPLLGGVAAAYEESRPWVTVSTEVFNTTVAERTLREGDADLALLSWLGEPEDEEELWSASLARDGVAVIVHPASPLTEIGLGQLRDIFRGRLQEWGGTLLTVVSREDGSGTRTAFETFALDGQSTTLNAVAMPSSEAVVEYVASTPGAIGYVSTLWLTSQGERPGNAVRVLPVEGLLPTELTIGDGSYVLWRQLYLASSGEPKDEAREFAQWLLRGGALGSAGVAANQLNSAGRICPTQTLSEES
jgi:phosphate transport system substrate-binding protein